MTRLLHLVLRDHTKTRNDQGFTLIELLVALIIAVLVMTPLMGLAINLINTDRREQAKSTSEQELQAAADFIARDLERAIYVYDAVALTRNYNTDPLLSGIRDQIPPHSPQATNVAHCKPTNTDTCIPILAFWTRRPIRKAVPANNNTNCSTANVQNVERFCDDTFVYNLVVYYLILDTPPGTNPNPNRNVWSTTARIGRFSISDGVKDRDDAYLPANQTRAGNLRDPGFIPFDLSLDGETIRTKMNQWRQGQRNIQTGAITPEAFGQNSMQILVDYIDHTTIAMANNKTPSTTLPFVACPNPDPNNSQNGWLQSPYYGNYNPVPNNPALTAVPPQFQTYSFYACINGPGGIAQVHLRGNALARIQSPNNPPEYGPSPGIQAFFPTISLEVNAQGAINQ